MDSDELAEWQAFDRISPIGLERLDWQAALIANTIARCHGNRMKIADFLLRFGAPDPPVRQTPAEQLAILKRFAELHNARWKANHPDG